MFDLFDLFDLFDFLKDGLMDNGTDNGWCNVRKVLMCLLMAPMSKSTVPKSKGCQAKAKAVLEKGKGNCTSALSC